MGGVVEVGFAVCADCEVEGGAEEAAFAAGEAVCELVCVLGRGGDGEVCEAAAFPLEPACRLEPCPLLVQPLRGDLGRERLDVQRELDLRAGTEQRREPAVADLPGVAAHSEGLLPPITDPDAVCAQLEDGRAKKARGGDMAAGLAWAGARHG